MDFNYSEEQTMLADSARRFIRDAYPFEVYDKAAKSAAGHDQQIWAQIGELQWLALPFSEGNGGLGCGPTELMLVAEEMGRGLCIEPYLANVILAGQTLARRGSDEQRQKYLPGLLDGSQQISLAFAESEGRYDLKHCATTAKQIDAGWELSGKKSVVLNGPNANTLLVVARTDGNTKDASGLSIFMVDAQTSGLSRRNYSILGGGVASELSLSEVQVPVDALLGAEGDAYSCLSEVIDLATAYSCAEAYGAMQAMLEKTGEYLKTRKQFGMPLGAFQVLQHRLVDMFVEVQQSQSLILMLALKMASDDPAERQLAVSMAKAYLHKSSKFVAQQAVQLHGGIGVTEELDIGHYFRRLTAFGNLFGDRAHHLDRVIELTDNQSSNESLKAVA